MEKLTIQEEEVMLHIWSMGECFVKDIVAKFPEPKPPYTTVASIVTNLKRKGYVTAKRFGNTYQYTPVVKQSEYKRTFVWLWSYMNFNAFAKIITSCAI